MKFNKLIPELTVTDINESKRFYNDILGFDIMYERNESGFVFLSREDSQIMLVQLREDDDWQTGKLSHPFGRGINISIEVADVVKLHDEIVKKGYKIFALMEDNFYRQDNKMLGNREFLVMDPDGYLLRFNQDIGEYTMGEE